MFGLKTRCTSLQFVVISAPMTFFFIEQEPVEALIGTCLCKEEKDCHKSSSFLSFATCDCF